jgi:hypothetical protein
MKTTIEIPDALLREARKVAAQEGITLRALVERGLHRVLAETKQRPPFRMRDGSVGGNGLHPDVRGLSWDQIIEFSYGDRGGSSLEQLRDKTDKERGG